MDNMKIVANNLIKRRGTTGKLILVTDGVYDTAAGEVVTVETQEDVSLVVLDFPFSVRGYDTEARTLRARGQKQVYMLPPASGNKPKAESSKLLVGGTTYRITNVKEYNPSTSDSIVFDLEVEL